MRRKAYEALSAWSARGAKRPLLVLGARQVGKSYLVERFLNAEFKHHITLNLMDRKDVVALFSEPIPARKKLENLEVLLGESIDFSNTALFFDEVQESEDLIESLKYFSESDTPYKIICAGSLLGVKLSRFTRSFPVGKVEFLQMHPLDFEEYLDACGEEKLAASIRESLAGNAPLPVPLHQRALDLFKNHLCCGGMPDAVVSLINAQNRLAGVDKDILTAITASYLVDMTKHVKNGFESARIESVYRSVPAQLANSSHKFQLGRVRKGARSREYYSALEWLISSGMVYECQEVSTPKMPLRGYVDASVFKLFLNDTGLLISTLEIPFAAVVFEEEFPYRGVLCENYVATQFKAAGLNLYYWRNASNSEVDFLVSHGVEVWPVEVKAGTSVHSPSLNFYRSKFHPECSIRISAKNFGVSDTVRSVPLYATTALAEELIAQV
ncbi:MAG: AAA family ATPase [Propionibacteriaceae bacterium]|jgi:predicted AAA+ superfamily ATPase|nr:AAA family ATPase [Propionibacteriaceae bacterium]